MTMEKFHFEHEGSKYEMPYFSSLKVGAQADLLEALEEENKPSRILRQFMKVAGDKAGAAIADMHTEEFKTVFDSWIKSTPGVPGK